MPSPKRLALLLSSFVVTACCASAETPSPGTSSQQPPPSLRLLWAEESPTEANFVPEVVLRSTRLEDLPLTKSLRESLTFAIKLGQQPQNYLRPGKPIDDDCAAGGRPVKAGSGPDSKELVAAVLATDTSVVVRVEELVQGWGSHYGGATTVVYSRVTRVLRDTTFTFEVGSEVAYPRQGADFPLQGVRLCHEPRRGQHQPTPGDTLLVSGYVYSANPDVIYANTVFAVVDGALVPGQQADNIVGRVSWTLEELEAALAAQEVRSCASIRASPQVRISYFSERDGDGAVGRQSAGEDRAPRPRC